MPNEGSENQDANVTTPTDDISYTEAVRDAATRFRAA
jgi:hypothetical protein